MEKVGLPDGARALQQKQRLLLETSERDLTNSPLGSGRLGHRSTLLLSSPISRRVSHQCRGQQPTNFAIL